MTRHFLPAGAGALAALAGAALLAACTVDPYTGALVGGYAPPAGPGYGSPPPGYVGGGPSYAPQGPGVQMPGEGWAGGMGPGAGGGGYGAHRGHLRERFATANTTGDGRLTLQQAEAANWRQVARHFAMIDVQHKGFVTMQDIRAWRQQRRAMRGGGNGGPGGGGQMGYQGGPGAMGYGGGPGRMGYGGPDEGEY
ncbi:MAG: hypothetical protein JO047_05105 [Alphaproteobacteria bacterium]|nr:hypothetical protein [Alphaproteobacteria bacterium]